MKLKNLNILNMWMVFFLSFLSSVSISVSISCFAENTSLVPLSSNACRSLCRLPTASCLYGTHDLYGLHRLQRMMPSLHSPMLIDRKLFHETCSEQASFLTNLNVRPPKEEITSSEMTWNDLISKAVVSVNEWVNLTWNFFSIVADDCQQVKQIEQTETQQSQKSKTELLNKEVPEEFFVWLKHRSDNLGINSNVIVVDTVVDLIKEFNDWRTKLHHNVVIANGSSQTQSISPITPNFLSKFDVLSANEKEYLKKMKDYYYSRTPIYKGKLLGYNPSTEEIVNTFAKMNRFSVGMGITPDISRQQIAEKFSEYNQDLIANPKKFIAKVKRHTNGLSEGESYSASGFSSFSKNPYISTFFARGMCYSSKRNGKPKSTATITSKDRRMGAVHGDTKTGLWDKPSEYSLPDSYGHKEKVFNEEEVSIYVATDPESIDNVVVKYFRSGEFDEDGFLDKIDLSKVVEAKRIDYNTIEVIEYIYDKDTFVNHVQWMHDYFKDIKPKKIIKRKFKIDAQKGVTKEIVDNFTK